MKPPLLVMEPFRKVVVWGSGALERFGKAGASNLGESWEVSCVPGSPSRDAASGRSLADIVAGDPGYWFGPLAEPGAFPFLVKLIATGDWLSLQVHPDDGQAMRLEGLPSGKRESWWILEAAPGSEIILGLNPGAQALDLRRALEAGTAEAVSAVVRRVPAKAGDVFDIPPGTLHALGPGLVLLEVQQPVDVTYRVFDWNRAGLDGLPRPLHVEKSLHVLDPESRPVPLELPRASCAGRGATVVDHDRFRLERWHVAGRARIPGGELFAAVCVAGSGGTGPEPGGGVPLSPGRSIVVPGAATFLDVWGGPLDLAVIRPPRAG